MSPLAPKDAFIAAADLVLRQEEPGAEQIETGPPFL